MPLVLLLIVGGAWFWWIRRAARRFEAEQRRLGRWDAQGPLVETAPPPSGTYGYVGGGNMSERLEVTGQWHGEIVNDRRPEAARAEDGEPKSRDDAT